MAEKMKKLTPVSISTWSVVTAELGKPACFSIASTIASNNNKIVNKIADQMIKDNLRLFSSANLKNSVSSTQHVATSNQLNRCLYKDFTEFGDQKLLRKAIINIPTAGYFQLESSANCIGSFLQFIENSNVKPTSTELVEAAENLVQERPALEVIKLSGMMIVFHLNRLQDSNPKKMWNIRYFVIWKKNKIKNEWFALKMTFLLNFILRI